MNYMLALVNKSDNGDELTRNDFTLYAESSSCSSYNPIVCVYFFRVYVLTLCAAFLRNKCHTPPERTNGQSRVRSLVLITS